jgi:hypothetical protein
VFGETFEGPRGDLAGGSHLGLAIALVELCRDRS